MRENGELLRGKEFVGGMNSVGSCTLSGIMIENVEG